MNQPNQPKAVTMNLSLNAKMFELDQARHFSVNKITDDLSGSYFEITYEKFGFLIPAEEVLRAVARALTEQKQASETSEQSTVSATTAVNTSGAPSNTDAA